MPINIKLHAAQKAAREAYINGLADVNMKFISEATAAEMPMSTMVEEIISNLVRLSTYYAVSCIDRDDYLDGCSKEYDLTVETFELMDRGIADV